MPKPEKKKKNPPLCVDFDYDGDLVRGAVKQMTDETPTRDGTSSGKRKLPSAMPRTTMRIGTWNKACRDSMESMSDSLFTVNSMDLRTS